MQRAHEESVELQLPLAQLNVHDLTEELVVEEEPNVEAVVERRNVSGHRDHVETVVQAVGHALEAVIAPTSVRVLVVLERPWFTGSSQSGV